MIYGEFVVVTTPMLDFIEVYEGLVDPAICAAICRRFDSSVYGEGLVGSGLYPDLKKSRYLAIPGLVEWSDMAALLMEGVLKALMRYWRKYPHVLLSPLILQHYPDDGGPLQRLGV
jgi:hypothetical protein